MIGPFLQKAGGITRPLLPFISGVVFILLSALALPFPYIGSIKPALGLMAIYYWAIYRPDLLRPWTVFMLGLLNDFVHLFPVGLSAFVYIGVYQLTLSQRRYFVRQFFLMLWSGFGLVAFLASLAMWCFMSLFEETFLAVLPVFMQFLMTVMFFPLPAWLLIKVQRQFLLQG